MKLLGRYLGKLVFGFLALGLVLSGCSAADGAPVTFPPSPSSSIQPSGTPTQKNAQPASVDHVVILLEENQNSTTILGNPAAPYINKLAKDNALATNYRAVSHPSLPNYLALTSGTTAGFTNDCDPGPGCTAQVPNITDSIEKSGRTWKMYAESMPKACTPRNSGLYGVRHNPFMYYPSVTNNAASCAKHVVPLTQLATDLKSAATLPDYVFISPNTCNDMHDCPVATGDTWLSHQVPKILDSPAFTTQNSLLALTWDEDESANNTVVTIFAGPAAKKSYESAVPYTHYSLLRTIENLWGLAPLTQNDKNATDMSDMLRTR